jgi:gliding motility-associated-like protein
LTLIARNSFGCKSEKSFAIQIDPKPQVSINGPAFVCPGLFQNQSFAWQGNAAGGKWFGNHRNIPKIGAKEVEVDFDSSYSGFELQFIPISQESCLRDTAVKSINKSEVRPEIQAVPVLEPGRVEIVWNAKNFPNAAKIVVSFSGFSTEENVDLSVGKFILNDLPTAQDIQFALKEKDQCGLERTSLTHTQITGSAKAISQPRQLNILTSWTEYPGNAEPKKYALYQWNSETIDFELVDTSSSFEYTIENFQNGSIPSFKVKANWEKGGQEWSSWSDQFEASIPKAELVFPNLITPNGDEKNDLFEVGFLHAFPDAEIEFRDRWGKMVFQEKPYKNQWKPSQLHKGIYFYFLKTKENSWNGRVYIKK